MPKKVVLELFKERFKFSAGHFTIFSATERENLHGHNFTVYAAISCSVGADGLAFDYAIYKKRLEELCKRLDERFLLPSKSPHLTIASEPPYVIASFNGERIPFLERDALVLPVANVTLEELAHWFLAELQAAQDQTKLGVHGVTIKISNGPGQFAAASSGDAEP